MQVRSIDWIETSQDRRTACNTESLIFPSHSEVGSRTREAFPLGLLGISPAVDNGRNHDKRKPMEDERKKKLTVQGVGSPVPAVVRGDRAGPGASISSDCKATEVEHLASVADNATSCSKGNTTGAGTGEGGNLMKSSTPTAEKVTKGEKEADPFRRSTKLPWFPPSQESKPTTKETQSLQGPPYRGTPGNRGGFVRGDTSKPEDTKKDSGETATALNASPKRAFLIRMRKEEEEALRNCKAIMARMRTAVYRQKTVSMEIKNGIVDLEEALDVISSCRANWEKAEAEL